MDTGSHQLPRASDSAEATDRICPPTKEKSAITRLITNELLSDFVECKYRAYLKLTGTTEGKPPDGLRSQLVSDYHIQARDHVLRTYRDRAVCTDLPLSLVLAKRYDLAIDVTAIDADVSVHFDALIAAPGAASRHRPQYIPILFTPEETVRNEDKVLLAIHAFILSRQQGAEPLFGRILHGSRFASSKVYLRKLWASAATAVFDMHALRRDSAPPPLHLNRYCPTCEFRDACRAILVEKDDLSLLRGIKPKEILKLRNKGIFTVTQLSYTFRARKKSKRPSPKTVRYYHSLKALALRENRIYVAGKPELKITGAPVYLDVEGNPDRDSYYLIGLRMPTLGSLVQRSLWADDSSGEERIWREFLDILAATENPQLIHYGRYEMTFLRRMERRYGNTADVKTSADKLIENARNVLSAIYGHIYFPTYSNGLKDVASYLGFKWSTENPSGHRSLVLRHRCELTGSIAAKQELIAYNADDCAALELLVKTILRLIPEDDASCMRLPHLDAVHVDSLKPQLPYQLGPVEFVLPDLERINKCAYWDYQRDRIYIRSNPRLRRIARSRQRKKRRSLPANIIVGPSRLWKCPNCDSRKIELNGRHSKLLYDLRFSVGGMRRWISKYRINHYKCRRCGISFPSDEYEWTRHRHGLQLLAYVIHNIIELHIPQLQLSGSIERLFGYRLGQPTIHRLKRRATELYRETYDRIKQRLLDGKLVHADETHMSLKGKSGYVWVFASMEEVVYLWSATREGSIAGDFLSEFKGVLVSDFYAAYDSIQCAQQRCLIHLIRDLNGVILKEPFNEEMKALIHDFTALLKPIIETIDRFGLKTRFLRKHKRDVARFYDGLLAHEYRTEVGQKARERFRKNRGRLFTFLDYDDVPWNNNNAEHAIKAFVGLRNVIETQSNESGVRDYLMLLSICQTCKYRGLDFLDFLQSGEKRIGEYVQKKP